MKTNLQLRRSVARGLLGLALGAAAVLGSTPALAGCGATDGQPQLPMRWEVPTQAGPTLMPAVYRPGEAHLVRTDFEAVDAGIIGLWRFSLVSDGTAYPAPIPYGAIVDFGTTQWHSDGTEIMFSGSRPPSTGDVCMGVWKKTGPNTYKLKHIALAWISADTPPPLGPRSPAVFVGPAIITELVTLDRSRNSFEGSFTIDQYAQDETTLLEHVAGRVKATRISVD